jgi:hypothetical protein
MTTTRADAAAGDVQGRKAMAPRWAAVVIVAVRAVS